MKCIFDNIVLYNRDHCYMQIKFKVKQIVSQLVRKIVHNWKIEIDFWYLLPDDVLSMPLMVVLKWVSLKKEKWATDASQ